MNNLQNMFKKFVIKKGTQVARFGKNGRKYDYNICLHNDMELNKQLLLGIEKSEDSGTINAKFTVGSGYMTVGIENIIGVL